MSALETGSDSHLQIFLRAGRRLNSTLHLREVYEILEEIVAEVMDCEGMLISSYDSATGLIRCEYAWVGGQRPDPLGFPALKLDDSGGMQSEVIRTGQAMIFGVQEMVHSGRGTFYDVEPDGTARRISEVQQTPTHSAVMSPIKIDGEVVGVIQVMCDRPGAYTSQDQTLLEGLALQTAAATKNARLYAELAALNEDLEKRVRERTVDMEMAVRELEGFCYSISHDLRGPVRAICGHAAVLKQDFPRHVPSECLSSVVAMSDAALKLSRLIDGLLGFSRLGRKEMVVGPVDLSQIAERVAQYLRSENPDWNAEIEIDGGLTCTGDEQMLEIVLLNLMENALKFSSTSPQPAVRFGSEVRGDLRVYFVRDNGVGFEQEYVSKLFKPFERLHSEAEFEGTGIGLANVKRIIERHGGAVWAEGTPGDGATVYFTLPV